MAKSSRLNVTIARESLPCQKQSAECEELEGEVFPPRFKQKLDGEKISKRAPRIQLTCFLGKKQSVDCEVYEM